MALSLIQFQLNSESILDAKYHLCTVSFFSVLPQWCKGKNVVLKSNSDIFSKYQNIFKQMILNLYYKEFKDRVETCELTDCVMMIGCITPNISGLHVLVTYRRTYKVCDKSVISL